MSGPIQDKVGLFAGFRGIGMDLALGNLPPPVGELAQRRIAVQTLAYEITADRCSGPTDATPAMKV